MLNQLFKHKKKIIISIVTVFIIGIAIAGGYYGIGYNYAKKNENYTEKQVREIALSQSQGEILSITKDFELEDDNLPRSEFEYEIEIKTPENLLNVVKVSARTGVVEIDHED